MVVERVLGVLVRVTEGFVELVAGGLVVVVTGSVDPLEELSGNCPLHP